MRNGTVAMFDVAITLVQKMEGPRAHITGFYFLMGACLVVVELRNQMPQISSSVILCVSIERFQ